MCGLLSKDPFRVIREPCKMGQNELVTSLVPDSGRT